VKEDYVRGVTDNYATLEQQLFNVSQAQLKADVPTHSTAMTVAGNQRPL
jgi:hypothetical protein